MQTKVIPVLAAVMAAVPVSLNAATLFGPSPYVQQSDSPFNAEILAGTVLLENFEDDLLNTPGVTASTGSPSGASALTDSVDADDGVIDGSGTTGRSFFASSGPAGISFIFSSPLPTRAGIVWTDAGGGATVTFQAFDGNNVSLGVFPGHTADGSNFGETAEDRFYGVLNDGGISRILISNSSGGIEVDHLQFGAVPEPGPAVLMIAAAMFLGAGARRRRK